MEPPIAKEILDRYLSGTGTLEERAQVENWYNTRAVRQPEMDLADEIIIQSEITMWKTLNPRSSARPRRLTIRWAAAAALFVILFAAAIYWKANSHVWSEIPAASVLPGTHQATLTLSDGTSLVLDTSQQGIRIQSENITYPDGFVVPLSKEVRYATLSTPKGGQYQATLPDGSKVWLNAESSLTYPLPFDAQKRRLQLQGEAYFEVISLPHKTPFVVETATQAVQVIGTEFNIRAYTDDFETQTTLVGGRVQITPMPSNRHIPSTPLLLHPGEQSVLQSGQLTKRVVPVDQYTAWTKGYFKFSDDLENILKQISRWYDVEVVYRDESLKKQRLFGIIYRNQSLEEALKILSSATDIHFRVEEKTNTNINIKERRIIVMP